MSSRQSPKPILFVLPLLFVVLLVMFLPAIFGSAEAEQNITALEHSNETAGIMDTLLVGDMILPVLGVLIILAILLAAFTTFRRRGRGLM